MSRKVRKNGALFICGLGIDRPMELTLRAVETLKRCDAVFCLDEGSLSLPRFLNDICPGVDIRPVKNLPPTIKDNSNRTAAIARPICEELRRGKKVAYLSYGHPCLMSDSRAVYLYCRGRGYRCRVITAPSAIDGVLSALADTEVLANSFFVCHAEKFLTNPSFHAEAVVMMCAHNVVEKGMFDRFCEKLEELYPPNHPVHFVACADGTAPQSRRVATIKKLRRMGADISPRTTLILSPTDDRSRGSADAR